MRANPDPSRHDIRSGWWVFPIPSSADGRHAEPVESNGSSLATQSGLVSPVPIAGTPWSVRQARGSGGQPALEIYEDDDLIGVTVANAVAPQLLRGARCVSRAGQTFSLAWGRLPADGSAMTVRFSTGRRLGLTRRRQDAGAIRPDRTELAGWCWLAASTGQFDTVKVATRATSELLRFRAGAGR